VPGLRLLRILNPNWAGRQLDCVIALRTFWRETHGTIHNFLRQCDNDPVLRLKVILEVGDRLTRVGGIERPHAPAFSNCGDYLGAADQRYEQRVTSAWRSNTPHPPSRSQRRNALPEHWRQGSRWPLPPILNNSLRQGRTFYNDWRMIGNRRGRIWPSHEQPLGP